MQAWAAIAAAMVISLMMVFQVLLAAGLPLGQAAWGGRYRVLPSKLRWASLAALALLGTQAWLVLARAGLVAPGGEPLAVRVATWACAGFLALNTLGNLASQSRLERFVMTPVTLLLGIAFAVVALS